jgi:hypothetical protein
VASTVRPPSIGNVRLRGETEALLRGVDRDAQVQHHELGQRRGQGDTAEPDREIVDELADHDLL